MQNPLKTMNVKKYCIWNPSTCGFELSKYLKTIAKAVITCDELIDIRAKLYNKMPDNVIYRHVNDKNQHVKWIISIFLSLF